MRVVHEEFGAVIAVIPLTKPFIDIPLAHLRVLTFHRLLFHIVELSALSVRLECALGFDTCAVDEFLPLLSPLSILIQVIKLCVLGLLSRTIR